MRIPGTEPLSEENKHLRPDVWYFDRVKNTMTIIEVNCPYDSIGDDSRSKLSRRREEKLRKYESLVDEIRTKWEMSVRFHVIVVSSLGTVPKETKRDLLALFGGDSKLVNEISRSLTLNTVRESALIYWNIDRGRYDYAEYHAVNPANIVTHNAPEEESAHNQTDSESPSDPDNQNIDQLFASPINDHSSASENAGVSRRETPAQSTSDSVPESEYSE